MAGGQYLSDDFGRTISFTDRHVHGDETGTSASGIYVHGHLVSVAVCGKSFGRLYWRLLGSAESFSFLLAFGIAGFWSSLRYSSIPIYNETISFA